MIFSGIFHLVRVFDPAEPHRVWLGIAGLLFIVIGVVLIRHLHLTRSLIGLVIGITWIVQGLAALIGGISGGAREGRAWWIIFGVVSLIAGIVVAAAPASSLTALAVLLGIWFIIMGIFEIIGGLLLRHALRATQTTPARTKKTAGPVSSVKRFLTGSQEAVLRRTFRGPVWGKNAFARVITAGKYRNGDRLRRRASVWIV